MLQKTSFARSKLSWGKFGHVNLYVNGAGEVEGSDYI